MANKAEKEAAAQAEALAKIKSMVAADRAIADGLLKLVSKVAPELKLKLWYGMPAWTKADKVIIFFQSGVQFQTRYCTVGFQPAANLDKGSIWATSFAIVKLTKDAEKQIADLLKQAIS